MFYKIWTCANVQLFCFCLWFGPTCEVAWKYFITVWGIRLLGDMEAFPWQQRGEDGRDGTVQQQLQQMMDGRGDHLFVEQRQRFAALTPSVRNTALPCAVIEAALCCENADKMAFFNILFLVLLWYCCCCLICSQQLSVFKLHRQTDRLTDWHLDSTVNYTVTCCSFLFFQLLTVTVVKENQSLDSDFYSDSNHRPSGCKIKRFNWC